MQQSKLISYIKHPELLQRLSIEDLKNWVDQFPYSQNLRTLLAKKIKDEGLEDEYPEVFYDAAMYSTDRIKLYDNLNQEEAQRSQTFSLSAIDAHGGQRHTYRDQTTEELDEHVDEETKTDDDSSTDITSVEEALDTLAHDQSEEQSLAPAIENSLMSDRPFKGLSQFSQWLITIEQGEELIGSEEDQELISESLAQILKTQGYSDQAIDMYKKLALKYPEKSTYFAGQIEKIKNK